MYSASDTCPAAPSRSASGGWLALVILLALASLAGALLIYATPDGLLIYSGDSVDYLEGARNLLAGHGYSASIPPEPPVPVVHFPPLYSMVIAGFDALVHNVYEAARWVSVAGFGGSVLLLCALVWRVTERDLTAAVFAGLIFCFNPSLLQLFGGAVSETLFIPLGIAGQAALLIYLDGERKRWLMIAALLLGLTVAARYSGAVWIATGPLTVLICGRGRFVARFGKACVFGLVSVIPGVAESIRNKIVSHTVAGRSLGLHPVSIHHVLDGLQTIGGWFLPWRFARWPFGVAVACGLVALMAWGLRKTWPQRPAGAFPFWVSTAVFVVLYVAHLVVAVSFLHYNTPIDDRLLAPVEASAIAVLGVSLGRRKGRAGLRWQEAVCAAVLIFSLCRYPSSLHKARLESGGYFGPVWRSSQLIQTLRRLPPDAVIYSNKPVAVYLALDRPVCAMPSQLNPMSRKPVEDADAQIAVMEQRLKARNGVLVYFDRPNEDTLYDGGVPLSRLHEFTEAEIEAKIPLVLVLRADGADVLKPAGS
ncbi:MAG TPA: hypothetical protein VHY22_11225 [Chthoniobacteraceae bacterium]|jgi:hypothetical protein|nr:hypothetical protein [Chthoniobacteraceae bacterium]